MCIQSFRKDLTARFVVDVVNDLKIPGVVAPTGTPGAGKAVEHKQIYSTKAANSVLGMKFKDMSTIAKDTAESLKARFGTV